MQIQNPGVLMVYSQFDDLTSLAHIIKTLSDMRKDTKYLK